MTGLAIVHVHSQLVHEHQCDCILHAWHAQGQADTDVGPICTVACRGVDLCAAMLNTQRAANQQVLSQKLDIAC